MILYSKPLSFLVVEDNAGDLLLLESYLRETQIPIEKIMQANSLAALAGLTLNSLDLAFLDLSLPDSRGIDSFKQLNEIIPGVPIIVLSGVSDEETALACITLGAQDYLMKDNLQP